MNTDVANQYARVAGIMSDLEHGMFIGGETISPDIGIINVGGNIIIVEKAGSSWNGVPACLKDYIYEIISYRASILEEEEIEIPKELELRTEKSVSFIDEYAEFVENNLGEIYKIQEKEKCNFSRAVFGKVYKDRRKKEIQHQRKQSRNEQEFMH